mgnify:CR=1 FL=1
MLNMMKLYNSQDIYGIFSEGFEQGFFKRVGAVPELNTYVGKDDKGRYAFKFKGQYVPIRIFGSEIISVEQYEEDSSYSLLFLILETVSPTLLKTVSRNWTALS